MLAIAVLVLVLGTLALYVASAGEIGLGEIGLTVIVLLLVAFAMFIVKDKVKSAREGMVVKDERTQFLSFKAGYFGFIAAIWSAVLAPTLYDITFDEEMVGGHVTAAVVIVSGLAFMISYLVMQSRGD